ncbi:MAG: sugar phosphate isomerase/epimerase [Treponemataceae bacterium]|nr:sugar phosphate isomerase/epimerase [Treponemataceae bacterium]
MQFGMPTLIEIDNLEDTMKFCKTLGLTFIELNMNLPQYQTERLENISHLKSLKEKYGIGYTIHLDENLNICDFNKAVAAAYSDTVARTVRVARALDAPILNLHMNHGVHFTLPERKVFLFERYFEDYMESWKKFCALCENSIGDSEIEICIENTGGYKDFEKSAIEYALQSKAFGLTWDIGHSNAVANIDEKFILENSGKLRHFHVHDSLGKSNHLVLGDGEIDLFQRLGVAESHQCRCVIETKTAESLKKSVSWLKENGFM